MGSILISRGECRRLHKAANKVKMYRLEYRRDIDEMTDPSASQEAAISALVEYRRTRPLFDRATIAFERLRQSFSKKIHERSVTTYEALSEMDLSGLTHRELGAMLRSEKRAIRALDVLMMCRRIDRKHRVVTIALAESELDRRRAEKKAAWEKKQGGE